MELICPRGLEQGQLAVLGGGGYEKTVCVCLINGIAQCRSGRSSRGHSIPRLLTGNISLTLVNIERRVYNGPRSDCNIFMSDIVILQFFLLELKTLLAVNMQDLY